MIGDKEIEMTEKQWQEVESIVRKHQRSLLATFNNEDKERYDELNPILNELYNLAHGGAVCNPQAVMCKDHLTDE